MVYSVLILRLSEIRQTVMKLMDIARVIKARRTIHGNTICTVTRIRKIRKRELYDAISLLENTVNTSILTGIQKTKVKKEKPTSEVNEYESQAAEFY